jgi:Icc-related predicted phosphoesterase
MRCLITADLHYSLKQFDWLMRAAPDFDIVVLAGDHLDMFSMVDGRAQILVVSKYLERLALATQLLVSSGNHDLDGQDNEGERRSVWIRKLRADIPTDGDGLYIENVLFTICPWWDGPFAKARLAEQLAHDAQRERRKWIWIYHAPPEGALTAQEFSGSLGDADLTAWVLQYQPDFVFCGHAHNAPFLSRGSWIDKIVNTWVFNAGHQIGDVPAHIIIDTKAQSAMWSSLAGAQLADLTADRAVAVTTLSEPPLWLTTQRSIAKSLSA